jgi:hypothetical protein
VRDPKKRMLRQSKRLFVGRLVGKSEGSKTKRFAFDKPQPRPVRKKRLPLSMMKGWTKNRYSSIRSVPISDWTKVALPSIIMSLPGCCFRLVISPTTFHEMMVDSFHGAVESRDDILVHSVGDRPRTIAGRLFGLARPTHFIGDPSREARLGLQPLNLAK